MGVCSFCTAEAAAGIAARRAAFAAADAPSATGGRCGSGCAGVVGGAGADCRAGTAGLADGSSGSSGTGVACATPNSCAHRACTRGAASTKALLLYPLHVTHHKD